MSLFIAINFLRRPTEKSAERFLPPIDFIGCPGFLFAFIAGFYRFPLGRWN